MNNEIKFGALIDWLNGSKVGTNPFNMIPDCSGIYKIFVLNEDRDEIKFGAAKTVNGKLFCPSFMRNDGRVVKVTVTNASELQKHFTDLNDNVIYIGKATSLKNRLRQYAQMALGGHSHRGGIDIFAVQDYDKYLHVAWYPLIKEYATADEWETAEIENFKQEHFGQRPLANRAK
ncbi:MAG: GIY-YIG nuclease family protein [Clostridia bacterium]|nr:GIY-YIG nuclease family protein [Clostridia bacterium]